MNKKLLTLSFIFTLFISGCTCSFSKKEMLEKNHELNEAITEIKNKNSSFNESSKIIEFYNVLTTENMNAFVTVESKNKWTQAKKYSNGIIIGNASSTYYVLTDYSAISQSNEVFTIMDSYATSYSNVSIYSSDEDTGLAILSFSTRNIVSYVNSISTGEVSEIFAHLDSMEQLNKVTILDNIKSSTLSYKSTTYPSYSIDNVTINNGSVLVNIDNKLMAIYSSKMDTFIGYELIKEIVDFI